jgi:hypothetical protein
MDILFTMQAYQTSQYVVPRGGIFLGKWSSSFAGNSDGRMNVQLACALNTRYNLTWIHVNFSLSLEPHSLDNKTSPVSANLNMWLLLQSLRGNKPPLQGVF